MSLLCSKVCDGRKMIIRLWVIRRRWISRSNACRRRAVNAEQFVLHADEALYATRGAGKNRVMLRDTDGVYAPMTAVQEIRIGATRIGTRYQFSPPRRDGAGIGARYRFSCQFPPGTGPWVADAHRRVAE